MPARSIAAATATEPSAGADILESVPPNEPIGVRAAETMTTSEGAAADEKSRRWWARPGAAARRSEAAAAILRRGWGTSGWESR